MKLTEIAGVAEFPDTVRASNLLFHITHLDIENWIFEAAYPGCWNCDSKSQHSTRLTGCKQEWMVANLGFS